MSRTSDLVKAMVDIRDQDRLECGRHLFEELGHSDSLFITESQLDELLFKTVRKCLGTDIHADMLLMAFGLLPGYEYDNLSLGKRRMKFLRESNWLKVNRRSKIKDFDSASGDDLVSAAKSLANVERYWMGRIADEFIKQVKRKGENGEKIKDPIENYIKLLDYYMEEVRDASGKIIDYVPKAPPPPPPDNEGAALNEDFVPDEETTDSEETGEQNELEEDLSADEPKAPPPDIPPEENPPPGESEVPPSNPPPNPQRTHIWQFSIGSIININKKSQVNANLSWVKNPICSIVVIIVAVMACMRLFHPSAPPAEEPTIQNNVLIPGEIQQLIIVMPSGESVDELLEYISSDPSLITVSPSGFLMAHQGQPGESSRTAEITVQDENGVITTQSFTVDFTGDSYDPPVDDINDFVPDFSVTQKVRLVGDTEWHNYVDAEVGDELEIQFEYRNISEEEHVNVAVKDILPTNLEYIAGSTSLYNVKTPEGASIGQDGLVGNGIYIGTYGSGSNAYVRFRVRVIDTNLADGVTGLVNWSQACVNGVTLQDFSTVRVKKE